jgi:hypothetical protein
MYTEELNDLCSLLDDSRVIRSRRMSGPKQTANTGQKKIAKKFWSRNPQILLENLGVNKRIIIIKKRPLKSRIGRYRLNSCA